MAALRRARVKLTVDLRRYDPRLLRGSKGHTVPGLKCSDWGESLDFAAVQFDNGALLDILWTSLEQC